MNENKIAKRLPEIDLWRGLGCLTMVVAHPLRAQIAIHAGGGPPMPFFTQWLVLLIDIGAAIFFAAAGANVLNFFLRTRRQPDFLVTRFYFLSALLLFAMGYT